MGRLVICHGTGGSPGGNWFPWLAQCAERSGHEVCIPPLPTPEGQSFQSWLRVFTREVNVLASTDMLVGHSMGAGFVLRLLEIAREQIEATFLVSSFVRPLGLPEFDRLNESFIAEPFDWAAIRQASKKFFVYHGTNDPYVPLLLGQEVAEKLGVPLTVIDGGGHLNAESGYNRFDQLLADIDSISR